MSSWVPLHLHSHYSLLDGVSKPKQIAKRCVDLGYTACALTDHGGISGGVDFIIAMDEVCRCGHQKKEHANQCKNCDCDKYEKYPIKHILGSEIYICQGDPAVKNKDENWDLTHLPVLAKNIEGWRSLIKITSFAHHKDHFYRYPRIDLANLKRMAGNNLVAFSGHPGSDMANIMFGNPKAAYHTTRLDIALTCLKSRSERKKDLVAMAEKYLDTFGPENFFLEIQVLDPVDSPASVVVAQTLRWLGKLMKIPCVATADSHYPTSEDADDQRVLLCSALQTTLTEMDKKIAIGEAPFRSNFSNNHYHIPTVDEIRGWHQQAFNEVDEEALVNAGRIADMCGDYDVRRAPILPQYPCPNSQTPDEHLDSLCQQGWNRKSDIQSDEYRQRLDRELEVIKGAGLSSYFLIVQDYCNWARSVGMVTGPGRGSGSGCLISYLIGITTVDPIKYGLLFERFYNAGRNAPGHISLPDIDCDFPVGRRKEIVTRLKKKFGEDKVANIATFNSMKGKKALKDVMRAHGFVFELVNQMTDPIPEESRISEELQAMKDRGDEPSIIRYVLENDPDSFRDWCVLKEDGVTLEGEYWPQFAQAMRLEGTKTNISTHAAGVVLASTPLADLCPLIYDDGNDMYIAGMEYGSLEAQGQVKLDILGVASLDRIAGIRSLLRNGYISEEDATE